MADTELEDLTALAAATVANTDVFYIVDVSAGTAHKITVADLKTVFGTETSKVVSSTQTSTSVTPAAVTALSGDSLAPGTYAYKGQIIWQSAATTTGISLYVTGTGGTVTRNVGHTYTTTTGTTATTGVADQATVAATFQMLESRAWRANATDPGPHGGVDTANADQFSMIEGVIVVSATTVLDVMFRTEVASSGVSIMAGSSFTYEKVA